MVDQVWYPWLVRGWVVVLAILAIVAISSNLPKVWLGRFLNQIRKSGN